MKGFLHALDQELSRRGLSDKDTLAEVESHLLDSIDQGLSQGLSPEQAQQRALERFGSPSLLAGNFEKERCYRMQKILLVCALVSGLLIAYVDSRPTWDDTGITVFALLVTSGIIGLLVQRRPWLYALAIGLWIPLWGIIHAQNVSMLLVLLFPFVGVYAGWALRLVVQKTLHLA